LREAIGWPTADTQVITARHIAHGYGSDSSAAKQIPLQNDEAVRRSGIGLVHRSRGGNLGFLEFITLPADDLI